MKHYSTYQSQFIKMFNEKGYPLAMIKSFADVSTGGTPSKANPEYWNGDKPWVSAEDMKNKYVYDTLEKVTEAGYATCKIIPVDTLMYVCRGSIGVMAINKIECATNQSICRAKCHDNVCNVEFLYHALMYQRDNIKKMGTGTSFKSLNQTSFSELKIELPPYNEQMKFVSIAQQADKSKFTSLKSQFIEMFGNLDTNIKSYPVTTVEKISLNLFAGGDKPEDTSTERTDKYIYPVWANGEGERGLMGYSKTYRVDKEALTISARGTIGYCAIREPYFTPIVRLITLIPNEKVDIVYLKYFFDQTGFESTGAVQGQLTIPTIKVKKVLVPPIEEQMKFAEVVKQADKSKYIN